MLYIVYLNLLHTEREHAFLFAYLLLKLLANQRISRIYLANKEMAVCVAVLVARRLVCICQESAHLVYR